MKLNCDDFVPFIDAYIDGEFDERDRIEMEAHLSHCSECRAKVEFQIEFREQFKTSLSAERAPDELRSRILSALEAEHASQIAQIQAEQPTRTQRIKRAGLMGAPIAAAAALMLLLPAFTIAPAASDSLPIVESTVDWHTRDYPLEIRATEAHEVRDWFHGKVDFPVRLPQFADGTANLVGARIAHVLDRRAAYVLYDVHGEKMSVFMFQGEGLQVPADRVRSIAGRDVAFMNANGYEIAVMRDNGVTYAMTTEIPKQRFLKIMRSSLSP